MSFAERRAMLERLKTRRKVKPMSVKEGGGHMAIKCLKCGQQVIGLKKHMEQLIRDGHKEPSWNKNDRQDRPCGGTFRVLKGSRNE